MEEFVPAEHRDTASSNANKFNLATNEENIDFNIPGVPNSMVKRSHGVNVHTLIQKVENHPQRQALQSDLQQHRPFNPFSRESQDAIQAAGNTELCEIVDVEPKEHNAKHAWRIGTLASSTARAGTSYEMIRQKTRSTSSLFLISSLSRTFTSGRADHTVTGTGRKKGCKEYHTANQLQKKCVKRKYKNIHDRKIRDLWFRKTMLELGRSEEIILEMDRLANEDQTHIATEEIDVFRGNWWIRSNFVGSDTMPVRHRPDFKKALSTLHRLKKAEDKAYYQNWSQSSSSSWWQWQTFWWRPSFETSPRRWT